MRRCSSTAPDLWTVGCQLEEGHAGLCRNNQVLWQWPSLVIVGGIVADPSIESDHWRGGEVILSAELTA